MCPQQKVLHDASLTDASRPWVAYRRRVIKPKTWVTLCLPRVTQPSLTLPDLTLAPTSTGVGRTGTYGSIVQETQRPKRTNVQGTHCPRTFARGHIARGQIDTAFFILPTLIVIVSVVLLPRQCFCLHIMADFIHGIHRNTEGKMYTMYVHIGFPLPLGYGFERVS